jgi:hypothetical protein
MVLLGVTVPLSVEVTGGTYPAGGCGGALAYFLIRSTISLRLEFVIIILFPYPNGFKRSYIIGFISYLFFHLWS